MSERKLLDQIERGRHALTNCTAALAAANAERDEALRALAAAQKSRRLLDRLFVLAQYGFAMEFWGQHRDDQDFLSVEWLENYYGEPLEDYVVRDLAALDERMMG